MINGTMTQYPEDGPAEVRQSIVEGRGLFARRAIPSGAQIGCFPLLILSAADSAALKGTKLYHYVFHVDEDELDRPRVGVAFGLISFCNHDPQANAAFSVDGPSAIVTLTALRDIPENAEIFIDYEEFAAVAV